MRAFVVERYRKDGLRAVGVGRRIRTFAKQLGAPSLVRVVTTLLSGRIRRQAKPRGVRYSFLFMRASGTQLREIGTLIDAGHLRPVVERVFPFAATLDELAYVERGRAKGKVVVALD